MSGHEDGFGGDPRRCRPEWHRDGTRRIGTADASPGRMMTDDRPYIATNTRERERLRALVENVDDDALKAPVNEYWTVAGVLGHIAYWDIRVLVLAEKIDRGEPWVAGDAEPEGDWLNDTTRPLIHAIAPKEAAQLAVRIAEETDALVAKLPLDRMWPGDPDSPINAARSEHRGEHLDEIEAALRSRAAKLR
jgi:hypothetical protein